MAHTPPPPPACRHAHAQPLRQEAAVSGGQTRSAACGDAVTHASLPLQRLRVNCDCACSPAASQSVPAPLAIAVDRGCMAGRRAVALVLLAGLAGVAHAGVIAVGSLQSCVNDGSVSGAAPAPLGLRGACLALTCRRCRPSQNPATSLECQNKIVVTINIESGSLYQTEELSFSVSCVNRCMLCAGGVTEDR